VLRRYDEVIRWPDRKGIGGVVSKSIAEGQAAGVIGTPTLFLGVVDPNTRMVTTVRSIVGAQPIAVSRQQLPSRSWQRSRLAQFWDTERALNEQRGAKDATRFCAPAFYLMEWTQPHFQMIIERWTAMVSSTIKKGSEEGSK
jgi:hypothetical protein